MTRLARKNVAVLEDYHDSNIHVLKSISNCNAITGGGTKCTSSVVKEGARLVCHYMEKKNYTRPKCSELAFSIYYRLV